MGFKPDEGVRWRSSNTDKTAVVVAVVPAGRHPKDLGFPMVGKESLTRGAESYVVRGGVEGGRQDYYWPVTSQLQALDGLSGDEISWCHANAGAVRELIASRRSDG